MAATEITTNTTTQVYTGRGHLVGIQINVPGSVTLRIFDSANATVPGDPAKPSCAGAGGGFVAPAAGTFLRYEWDFYDGLVVVTGSGSGSSITVVFNSSVNYIPVS